MTSWCPGPGRAGRSRSPARTASSRGRSTRCCSPREPARRCSASARRYRFGSGLTPRAREIATLAVAAHSGSEYELYAHERLGRQAGLTAAECAALRGRQDPGLADPAEQAVLRVTRALLDGGDIPDDLYLAAEQALGRAGLVELVTLAGYYLTLAMLMRTFRVDAPGDAGPPAR